MKPGIQTLPLCMRWLVAGLRQLEDTQRRVLHLLRKTVLGQVADLLVEEGRARASLELPRRPSPPCWVPAARR